MKKICEITDIVKSLSSVSNEQDIYELNHYYLHIIKGQYSTKNVQNPNTNRKETANHSTSTFILQQSALYETVSFRETVTTFTAVRLYNGDTTQVTDNVSDLRTASLPQTVSQVDLETD